MKMPKFTKYYKIFLIAVACLQLPHLNAHKDYEIWWENCLENEISIDTFKNWLGDLNSPSRKAMRAHVKKMNYKSILDVPSGLAIDFFGLMEDNIPIQYQGLDITNKLVYLAKKNNIPVMLGDIKAIPFSDNSFDIAYARHILEHLESYEEALTELIRVGDKEALIVFFIKPREIEHIKSTYENGFKLFHNTYCKSELETFIQANPKVNSYEWENIDDQETLLHIYLKKS